jgi:four helix bundle protein
MQDFRNLSVWQKSHLLTVALYEATRSFPKDEVYGLTSQIRRAGASIPANIAEGCGRSGDTEFGRFLQIALGSASELEYHLLLANDLKMFSKEDYARFDGQINEVKRMLIVFIQKLKAKS